MVGNSNKARINQNSFERWLLLALSVCVTYAKAFEETSTTLKFLVAERNEISLLQPGSNLRRPIASSNGTIVDVDYDHSENMVFWIAGSCVYSANWHDGNSSSAIIQRAADAWEPLSLAVDFLGRRLYVADGLGRKVDAFSLRGKNHVIVAAEDLARPSGVALDPHAALLFVADSDKIIRMNLDGASRLPIIRKTALSSIACLALDLAGKTLYWWNSEVRAIESSSYVGESRRLVYHDKSTSVAGIAHSEGQLYLLTGEAIQRADGRRSAETILGDVRASSLRAVDSGSRRAAPAERSACDADSGGCQHACLASAGGASCRCYAGNLLGEDAKSCTLANELLLYSHREVIRGRGLRLGAEIALSLARPLSLSLSVDSDFEAKALYFADANSRTIYRGDAKSGATEAVVGYEGSASLSLDWLARNLYYTDLAAGTLNVVSARNYSHRRTLLDGLAEPRDVVAHPSRGHVYFYDGGAIKRVNADGTGLTTIHAPRRHASLRLALDAPESRLYWCLNDPERASRNSSVQHAALDGSGVLDLGTPYLHDVSALAVHREWIYAVAAGFEKLVALRKADGKRMREIATAERQGFYALAVMRQPAAAEVGARHPCASAAACDKLCFAVPRTKSRPGLARRCGCPGGERLTGKLGGRTCKPDHLVKELWLVHRCEPDWEFACRNGRCIPKTQLCDGVNDCLDRSDEWGCRDTERNYFIAGG
ncbi:low-density lipoprotein receptor-related protein 2-like [Phymastichus coffea]|uniref:low-density lipoprotein receptor-related protein 2-like n=1 Tax=Phymastichus coffea TaxID=108790 RepID=UPI00273ACF79|nr:low-density lipoprotein receptor-related protein 2-like [Phymastichus coffea]